MYTTIAFICLFSFLGNSQNISFQDYTVDNNFGGPAGIRLSDLNNDNKLDIICAGITANSIAWWQNTGGDPIVWTKHIVDENFTQAIYVNAGDIDNDGLTDILGAAFSGNELAWWRNLGNNQWEKYTIIENFTKAHEIMPSDLDQDGDLDVLGVSADLHTISWFENDGNFPITWVEHIIVNDFAGARSVDAKDMDGDGDIDLAGAALSDHEISWWRNDGGNPLVFTKMVITTSFTGAHKVHIVDMDDDGQQDILGTAYGNGISWWKNDGNNPISWTQNFVSNYNTAVISWAIDIDNDMDKDIVGSADGISKLSVWENLGTTSEWDDSVIDNLGGAWPLHYGDIDNDGDIDLVCGGSSANDIKWYKNELYNNETVSDFDGNQYHTVQIGDQVWFKENLKSLHYSDGTEITEVWTYDDDESNADIYGRLYTWNAAMNYTTIEGAQGVCPTGWHLPTDDEWTELGNYLGGNSVAGGKLKSTGTDIWETPNTGATNESGFSALPAGEYDNVEYRLMGTTAVIWSSTETSSSWCKYRYLSHDDIELHTYTYFKNFRYSVRCIKDETVGLGEIGPKENKIQIYPNPAKESILIDCIEDIEHPITIAFYDVSAKLMKTSILSANKTIIDISDFPKGVYFVQTLDEGNAVIAKLIKK